MSSAAVVLGSKRADLCCARSALVVQSRGGGIRTHDPLHPMQVRYQAAPRPEHDTSVIRLCAKCQCELVQMPAQAAPNC
jgi:hypothetical protein